MQLPIGKKDKKEDKKDMSANAQAVSGPSKMSPWLARLVVLLGFACIALCVMAIMGQVQTNEAFFRGYGDVNIFHPSWDVLWQIPNLLQGQYDANEGAVVFAGWIVEIVYLIFVVCYEVARLAVHTASGEKAAKTFRSLSLIIVLFDGWTDYQYGTLGKWGHFWFAATMAFAVGFLGTIGMKLIEKGWEYA